MGNLKSFTRQKPRQLPVILLADISGSMSGNGKIQSLNFAIREMIESLSQESHVSVEINLAIITFGGQAKIHTPLSNIRNITWVDMTANGSTPMGAALQLVTTMFQDKTVISGRDYRPTIVLVSDGQPTDDYQSALQTLLRDERASKGFRMALAIGDDADKAVLQAFLADEENNRVFEAKNSSKIRDFFRLVTMSVSSRSKSSDPNSGNILSHIPDLDWEL